VDASWWRTMTRIEGWIRRVTRSARGGAIALGFAIALSGCGPVGVADGTHGHRADTPMAVIAPPAVTPVATTVVVVENFTFTPPVITVPVGATVTFTNQDIEQHTVTTRDKTFDSGVVANGEAYTYTFPQTGTYDYICVIHPEVVGRVLVSAP